MVAHRSDDKLAKEHQKCKILIMTSMSNHQETVSFFETKSYFGYEKSNFVFFPQGELPAVFEDGKFVLKDKAELAMGANGNGAFFESLYSNQVVRSIVEKLEYVQVIGVDNVMNKLLDPFQIGYTAFNDYEVTLKCCPKRDAGEKVGVFCKKNGKYDIVEYSEISPEQASATDENGKLTLFLGSILIFMFNAKKLLELCKDTDKLNEMYHVAHKKVAYYENGQVIKPETPNAYKFELFLHNFLPMCSEGKVGAIEVEREEEFGPVKNKSGEPTDTPESAL